MDVPLWAWAAVVAALGPKPALLVIDNCEHVLDGAAAVMVMTAQKAAALGLTPLARIAAFGPDASGRDFAGQPLAELYSPELADAQRSYISIAATLRAHDPSMRL